MEEKTASVGHRIAKAMFVVVFFWFFWKFGGFLINLIIGRLYGEVALAKDVYTFTYKLVIFAVIYPSLLKVIVPSFMPLFTERLQQGEEAAWDLANTVINIFVSVNAIMLCLGLLFTDKLVQTLAPGFDHATRVAAAKMLRIMFPGIFAMNMCILALAIQNAYKVFSYPSAGDAVQKTVWAVAILVGAKLIGVRVDVIAYGFLVGCALQIIVNIIGLRNKLHYYRPGMPLLSAVRVAKEFAIVAAFGAAAWAVSAFVIPANTGALRDLHIDPEFAEFTSWLLLSGMYACQLWWRVRSRGTVMARFAALAAPLLLGILFARWRDLTTAFFQSFTKAGWFGNLELAKTIGNLPHIMLGQALAIAMLPYLCELAAKRDWKAFGDVLTSTLRMLALVFIPLTIALSVLGTSIFQMIYDQGNWSQFDITLGGAGLRFFIWGLVFFAIENALMQSFFSTQKVWWPTLLGIGAAVFHITFMVGLVRWFRFDSPYEIYIATAASLPASRAFKNIILLVVTRCHVRILPLRSSLVFAVQLALVSLGVWASMHYPLRETKRVTPLAPLKPRTVTVDTFNFETKGWLSRDADVLSIEHAVAKRDGLLVSGRVVARRGHSPNLAAVSLQVSQDGSVSLSKAFKAWGIAAEPKPIHAAGLLLYQLASKISKALRSAGMLPKSVRVHVARYSRAAGANRHFLGVAYRKAGRRSLFVFPPIVPKVERDLRAFALDRSCGIAFRAKVDGPGDKSDFAVTIEDKSGASATAACSIPHDGAWHNVVLDADRFAKAKLGKLRRMTITDVTPVGKRERATMFLQLDDLAATVAGKRMLLDDFEVAGAGWQGGAKVAFVPNEAPGERALCLTGPMAEERRELSVYDLGGCDRFSLKIEAEQKAELSVAFVDAEGREFVAPAKTLEKTEHRKKVEFALADFKAKDGANAKADDLQALVVRVQASGAAARTWVDNVEFHSTRTMKQRLTFEGFKAARVFVPGLAGLVVFVLLVWLLRIEEGRQIFAWFKSHGLDMVMAKLGKNKPTAEPES